LLPATTRTRPDCMSTSDQFNAIASAFLKPLSARNNIIALSRTLHTLITACNYSASRTGKRRFSRFGMSNFTRLGVAFRVPEAEQDSNGSRVGMQGRVFLAAVRQLRQVLAHMPHGYFRRFRDNLLLNP